MMKALLWMLIGGGLVLIWFSPPGKKFVDDISETYCSEYYDIHVIPMPDKKDVK